jgi:hypothetical protein
VVEVGAVVVVASEDGFFLVIFFFFLVVSFVTVVVVVDVPDDVADVVLDAGVDVSAARAAPPTAVVRMSAKAATFRSRISFSCVAPMNKRVGEIAP